jgi:hypothetical protein
MKNLGINFERPKLMTGGKYTTATQIRKIIKAHFWKALNMLPVGVGIPNSLSTLLAFLPYTPMTQNTPSKWGKGMRFTVMSGRKKLNPTIEATINTTNCDSRL